MKNKTEITKQFKKHKRLSESGLTRQYDNTRNTQAFYAGDIMNYKDTIQFAGYVGSKKKVMVQFNKVKPYVNAVKGFMAQNRRKAKYIARMEGNQLQDMYTRYVNSLSEYCRESANADQVETQQDGDMLINGYAFNETALTYGEGFATTDPNGQIIMGRLDPLMVGWDPTAKETNLLDSRWMFYGKDYDLEEAMDLFDESEEVFEDADIDSMGEMDGYVWYSKGGRYNKIKEDSLDWTDRKHHMVKVYFYQWYDYETFYRAENPIFKLTDQAQVQFAAIQLDIIAQEFPSVGDDFGFDPRAEILTFDGEVKERLKKVFEDQIEIVEFKRKTFYSAVLSGDHVFTAYKNHCQKGFTIKCKTGDYDSKNKIWVGMVNSMMEPSLYYNKALTELMFIIGANSKGGVLVERNAVEDIAKFEQKYAKTDAVIVVNDGAISGGKIQPKREPFTPTGYENIISLSDASISDVAGIDKTFLGSSENKLETGILQSRRIKQVVSSLACYFDAITLYQKEHARLMLDLMRVYAENNNGSLFRVLGDNGKEQYLQISANKLVNDYDVVIQESPQSPEDKQVQAGIMNGIADKLLASGDVQTAKTIYAMALKYMQLDVEDTQKLTELLVPQDQNIDPNYVKQLEQQIQALMGEANQVELKKKLSEIAVNTAKLDDIAAATHQKLSLSNKTDQEAVKINKESQVIGSENPNVRVYV